MSQDDAVHFVNEAFKHAKAISATNVGVDLLKVSQIQGVALAEPDTYAQLVQEFGVITIRNAADMGYFSHHFINAIAQHRHWIRQNQKVLVPA